MKNFSSLSIYHLTVIVIMGTFLTSADSFCQKTVDSDVLRNLPGTVLTTLHERFPNSVIKKQTKETEDGKVLYDIEFIHNAQKHEVDIYEDGSIHNWEKEVAVKDLPSGVRSTLKKKYPKMSIKEIMAITEVRRGKESLMGYEIVLETASNKMIEVTISPNGTVFEDSSKQ